MDSRQKNVAGSSNTTQTEVLDPATTTTDQSNNVSKVVKNCILRQKV